MPIEPVTVEKVRIGFPSNASQRILATAVILAFCYWAASVMVTLLAAVLIAYFLDPFVEGLESLRMPRAVGSFVVLLGALALVAALGWVLVLRVDQFGADWPKYRAPIRSVAQAVENRLERFEMGVSGITPEDRTRVPTVEVQEPHPVRSALLRRLGSVYSALLAATFIPFLVFFMLAAKRDVWHATMQLFPADERTRVKNTLDEVSRILRSYVVGTAMVGLILVVASWLLFWAFKLDFPFLAALLSGLLNLVPYLGIVMAWMPPILIGLKHYHTIGPFLGIMSVLAVFHVIAANVLMPAMVGRKVHLNALAVTVSLLFWSWLWGGVGFLLAIPITATIKVICDHIDGWKPVGRWLGA